MGEGLYFYNLNVIILNLIQPYSEECPGHLATGPFSEIFSVVKPLPSGLPPSAFLPRLPCPLILFFHPTLAPDSFSQFFVS